ncbi:MAG TPA: cytochrome b/b6 domain-containing protein [Vicinamibacterales bacterium]|nr:cytochrome b/b6 domain-containing protein [Vicinamibacterales bacterium]
MNRYVVRFTLRQRIEHLAVMTLFTVLVVTGLPQKFFEAGWAETVILGLGGIDRVRWVHRAAGVLFTAFTAIHLTQVVGDVLLGRGSLSMVPTRRDFEDAIQQIRYYLGTAEAPARFDRFDYRQKFEYWGLVFGAIIVIATGFVLLFPIAATRFLPGEIVPASKLAHGNEGLMAFLVVIIWHIYNAHLSPDVFPFDKTIFTGTISVERMHHEHPLEYERLKAQEE